MGEERSAAKYRKGFEPEHAVRYASEWLADQRQREAWNDADRSTYRFRANTLQALLAHQADLLDLLRRAEESLAAYIEWTGESHPEPDDVALLADIRAALSPAQEGRSASDVARGEALRAYWAATVGDDPDNPCPDDDGLMEPEDVGAIERMVPVIAALIERERAAARVEAERQEAAMAAQLVVAAETNARLRGLAEAAEARCAMLTEALRHWVAVLSDFPDTQEGEAGVSEAYRRVAQQPGKEDVKGSARAHDSLVHACVAWLKLHGIEAAAINQKPHRRKDGTWHTPGAPRGFGDIVACIPPFGRMWVIECKTGKSRVRPEQVEAAGEWTRAGALWDIVRSVDELPAKLEIRGAVFDGLGRPTFR